MAMLSSLKAGDLVPTLIVEITRADLVRYAGAADDYVRQHWDHPFMIASGFPDVIVHGWLTFGQMSRAVTDWLPPSEARISAFGVRYRKPTYPGTISCGGEVISVDNKGVHLSLWAKHADGEITTSATMTVAPKA